MIVRMIVGADEADAVLRFRAWYRDPDASTFTVHKLGSEYTDNDGKCMVIGADGEPRPKEGSVQTCRASARRCVSGFTSAPADGLCIGLLVDGQEMGGTGDVEANP